MPFSGTTFSEIKAGSDEVAQRIRDLNNRVRAIRSEANALVTDVNSFGSQYGPIVSASATLLATDPQNPAFLVMDADIQKYLADFNTLAATVTNLNSLVNPT